MFSYRDGAHVLLAKSAFVSCPFHLLNRYVSAANLDLSSSLPFFRSLHFHKVTSSYSWCSTGMSYTRTREIVLQPLTQASVIDFLNVTADGGLIGPKMAILRPKMAILRVHSLPTESMNASHSTNLFTTSCDHIFTNGKAPLHSYINHNNPQFLYSL